MPAMTSEPSPPTLFTRIINGDLPGHFVWRDPQAVAFLSIAPLQPGHTLVVPVEEVDHWIDCSPSLAAHLMAVSHTIGQALQAVYSPLRIGLIVAGFEVPHTHVHVIPTRGMQDLDFSNAASGVSPDALAGEAAKIRTRLAAMGRTEASE